MPHAGRAVSLPYRPAQRIIFTGIGVESMARTDLVATLEAFRAAPARVAAVDGRDLGTNRIRGAFVPTPDFTTGPILGSIAFGREFLA